MPAASTSNGNQFAAVSSALPEFPGEPSAEREWTTTSKPKKVILSQGTIMTVGPNSRVRRTASIPVSLGREFASHAYSIELFSGRIDFDISEKIRPFSGVVIRAPRKVSAIAKVGQSTVMATPEHVTVAAKAGRDMMTGLNEKWRGLRAGMAFCVTSEHPEGVFRKLLGPPSLQIDSPVAIAIGSTMTPRQLSWSTISGSKMTVLLLYQFRGDEVTLMREQRLLENTLPLGPLPAGTYGATVASLDESELESRPSPTVRFTVVEAVLPSGAKVTGDTVELPQDERIRLLSAENLEMAYGRNSNDFVAAPPSVGLHNGQPVQIRLREKGRHETASLYLVPTDLVVKISIGPARAKWPGPPIVATLTTRHRDGTVAPLDNTLVPSVTINNDPVKVSWRKQRGSLSAEIEKPPNQGPWVVRVLVHDLRGQEVQREILEVASDTDQEVPKL